MLNISFDFDEKNREISNIKITDKDIPHMIVMDNKIELSDDAIRLLRAEAGDNISINYVQKSNELTIPLISKSTNFGNGESGNKLTKSNTFSFKGRQNKILQEYGEKFEMVEYEFIPDTYILKRFNNKDFQRTIVSSEEIKLNDWVNQSNENDNTIKF